MALRSAGVERMWESKAQEVRRGGGPHPDFYEYVASRLGVSISDVERVVREADLETISLWRDEYERFAAFHAVFGE